MNTKQIEKQTKASFYRAITSGVRFCGAVWRKDLSEVVDRIANCKIDEFRKIDLCQAVKTSTGIMRKTDSGEWSHTTLDKNTTVYKLGNFWILFKEYSNNKSALIYLIE